MELEFDLTCTRCGDAAAPEALAGVCDECGSPLKATYPLDRIRERFRPEDLQGRPQTMWRYREVLPVAAEEDPITLGEGGTPLLQLPELAGALGVRQLWIKEEGLNPTGTFKARGMSSAVTRAREAPGLAVPSAGNAAAALAAYGARAGVPVRVYVPEDTPPAMIAECESLGAQVVRVAGVITDCAEEARLWMRESGFFDLSTLREPYRIEGKKTMGYEICEQLGWNVPDAIIYPTGGGTGLIGMWKSFDELDQLGWIESGKRPRMYAVQSAACAPIVRAWDAGKERAEAWAHPQTVASGLRVPSALGDFLILHALRESEGAAVAVSDSALLRGARELRNHGIGACPEGGAALAGLRQLTRDGVLGGADRVVCFNTGALLKYLH